MCSSRLNFMVICQLLLAEHLNFTERKAFVAGGPGCRGLSSQRGAQLAAGVLTTARWRYTEARLTPSALAI